MTAPSLSTKELRRVVIAAAVGNVIEWYDFYIFGSLAAILSVQFFSKTDPVAAFPLDRRDLFGRLPESALGAFVFGRIGDLVGRKYTFLITLSGMGISTALIASYPATRVSASRRPSFFSFCDSSRVCASAGSTAARSRTSAEHVPTKNAATTPAGSRHPRHSESWCPWR